MESVIEELRTTLEMADEYVTRPEKTKEYVKFHIKSLQEDIDLLASLQTVDVEQMNRAIDIRLLARRTKRRLEHLLIDLERTEPPPTTPGPSTVEREQGEGRKGIKLPPLKVPVFDGDPTKFIVYWNVLVENVINNLEMTDTAKWIHLRESLTGTPAEIISEIPQTPEMLTVALKMLDDIYGGTERPIAELYQKLHNLPAAKSQTASIRITHAKLEGILLSLTHLQHSVTENQYVRSVYLGKFPQNIIFEVVKTKDTPLAEIRENINRLLLARESTTSQTVYTSETPSTSSRNESQPPNTAGQNSRRNRQTPSSTGPMAVPRCLFCQEEHWSDMCQKYDTLEKRKEKAANRCIKCLRYLHPGAECNRVRRCCYCDSLSHNRAFCDVKFGNKQSTEKVLAITEINNPKWTAKRGCFLTCMAKVSSTRSPEPFEVRILIDTAGSRTMVTKRVAEHLQLKPTRAEFHYTGVDEERVQVAPAADTAIRFHLLGGEVQEAGAYIVDELPKNIAVPDIEKFKQSYKMYDSLYIPPTGKSRPIDILIGGDNLLDFVFFDRGRLVDEEHQLLATKFGWMVVTRQRESHEIEPVLLVTDDDHIRTMFDLELVGLAEIQRTDVEQEQRALNKFHQQIEYNDGRYDVGWPWIEETPQLSANYGLAYGRLRSLYKKLRQQPQLLRDYNGIILQQESDGIVERVSSLATPNLVHYMPHHPVICPDKNTTTRLVYDASAKASPREKSLNENIHKGSKWLSDMSATLLRFRRHEVGVVSDISKAFHQIGIVEKDRDVLRFLWLKDISKPPDQENIQIFRFKRVAFGVVASPFLLNATISYHLRQQQRTACVEIIEEDLYADNLVTSLDSTINKKEFYTETKRIFATMAMNMTKWASSSGEMTNIIPEEDRNDEIRQNVLGLRWDRKLDTLAIKPAKEQRDTSKVTKRNVLRKTASIFDPLGWAGPIILVAKLFIKRLWIQQTSWDEEIQKQAQIEWSQITACLNETQKVTLPRQMFPNSRNTDQTVFEYHTFVDASALAFAAVIYVVKRNENGVYASFVASKNRITPKKQISIPKLELIALHVGVKFTSFVEKSLNLGHNIQKFVWSDSQCVLAWMKSERILPALIHRQVEQIKQYGTDEYKYVPTEENRADVATRGATYYQLRQQNWWKTPSWILDKDQWPKEEISQTLPMEVELMIVDTPETKKKKAEIFEKEENGVATIEITKYSSLHKLLQVTANCIRAIQKMRPKQDLQLSGKNAYALARLKWIQWDQRRAKLHKLESIGKLKIVTDSENTVRATTRMNKAALPYDAKNPIVLVNNSTLTKLIIMHLHIYNKHAGTAFVLAALRRGYYLPRARREIYHVIRSTCFRCIKFTSTEYAPPPPADLPNYRVTEEEKPFTSIGLDVFGPFSVRLDEVKTKPKTKRWVMIFVCAVIRAVHMEVIEDMTTKEMLLAFRRFVARRGVPKRVLCDNAPQFGALDYRFQNIWKSFASQEQCLVYFAPHQIEWKFIPQHSPWMGGMYERLIRSVKQSLNRTYGALALHHRQFEASILEIEGILNCRPITYIEDDTESPILTPAHFLNLRYPAMPIDTTEKNDEEMMAKLWKASQRYIGQFWQHWSEYYILALRDRHDELRRKGNEPVMEPKSGDIVLVADPDVKRTQWRLAVIERLVHSADGKVRSAQIKLPNGTRTLRPIIKLAPMGLNMELPGVEDDQLNIRRDAIILQGPEGAAEQQQRAPQVEEVEEVIELGLDDIEAET